MENSYYKSKSDKVKDFFVGFFTNIGIALLFFALNFITGLFLMNTGANIISISIGIIWPLYFILVEIRLIKGFIKERKYALIGLLSTFLLPLLITGYCSFAFMSGMV